MRSSDEAEVATLKRRVSSGGRLRRRIEIEGPCHGDPETSVAFVAARLLTLQPLERDRPHRDGAHGARLRLRRAPVELARDRVSYPVGDDEWRLEAEGAADDVERDRLACSSGSRSASQPVRRGKVQTLLRRCAA